MKSIYQIYFYSPHPVRTSKNLVLSPSFLSSQQLKVRHIECDWLIITQGSSVIWTQIFHLLVHTFTCQTTLELQHHLISPEMSNHFNNIITIYFSLSSILFLLSKTFKYRFLKNPNRNFLRSHVQNCLKKHKVPKEKH